MDDVCANSSFDMSTMIIMILLQFVQYSVCKWHSQNKWYCSIVLCNFTIKFRCIYIPILSFKWKRLWVGGDSLKQTFFRKRRQWGNQFKFNIIKIVIVSWIIINTVFHNTSGTSLPLCCFLFFLFLSSQIQSMYQLNFPYFSSG